MTTKGKCSQMVYDSSGYGAFHPHPCKRNAIVEIDGKLYCKIHDPEYIKRKDEIAYKKYEAESNIRIAGNIAREACQKINPDNPRAVAEAIPLMYEALKAISKMFAHDPIKYETIKQAKQALNKAEERE